MKFRMPCDIAQCGRWLAFVLCLALVACHSGERSAPDQPAESSAAASDRESWPGSVGMPIRAYNYTYEDIDNLTVNGSYGPNAPPYGGGGGETCCVSLPFAWHEGQTVTVTWTMSHWTKPWEERQHMSTSEQVACCSKQRTLRKVVPVQRYDKPSYVQVFFLPNDELEVWVSRYDLGHPDHPSGREYPVNPGKANQSKTN